MAADRSASPLARLVRNELAYRFLASPLTVMAAIVGSALVGAALLAPWVAPHNPFDVASLDLMNSLLPPSWSKGGDPALPPRPPTTRGATCSPPSSTARGPRSWWAACRWASRS